MNLPLSGPLNRAFSIVAFCSLLLLSGCMSVTDTAPPTQTAQLAPAASPTANAAIPLGSGKAAIPTPSPTIASAKSTADSGSVVVKSTQANLRKEASASSAVIEEIPQGNTLALVDKKPVGPWYKVKNGQTGAEGWIHGNGITLPNEPAIIYKVEPQATPKAIPTASFNARPVPAPPDLPGRYYTNVDGKKVHSPVFTKTAPAGASARCGDGSYSFSQNRRGTCSHHGGVAEWL